MPAAKKSRGGEKFTDLPGKTASLYGRFTPFLFVAAQKMSNLAASFGFQLDRKQGQAGAVSL
jgi:hypothetical protein